MQERKLYVLNEPILEKPVANSPRLKGMLIVSIKMTHLMLHVSCLPPWNQIHKQMVDMGAVTMVGHLREMFQDQVYIERFATIKTLLSYKMIAGSSVSPHVLRNLVYRLAKSWPLTSFSNLYLMHRMVLS